jgi:hypothetical protein
MWFSSMALAPGSKLGPYEILAPIGAGGMGEVYRSRDTRLNRSVAIKVCAEQFGERFEREARAISALNHPHICTLHDVGPNYLVMELIEGPTLAERIAAGALPVAEALSIARQIAEALEAAHEKGVIHRDLKPANVKLTSDDSVKVLDFGLAKVAEAAACASSDPGASPTMTLGASGAGLILGTAAYMSPEQACGAAVDRRADVWAFGCVLYEMLAGTRTFNGETMTDVLAAVMRADPDWSALPEHTPEPVRRLLKRCLEKDRKRRLPDIGVARLEIDDALAAPATPQGAVPAPKRRTVLTWVAAALALLGAAAAGALWQYWRAPAPALWSGVMLGGPARAFSPRLSPDGQLLAFLAFIDELPQLGVMKPGGGSWTMLTRDRESGYIATASWATDGSKIYFDRYWGHPRGVYSVPPLGGEPRLLLEDAYGPTPLPDGSLIVAKLTEQADHRLFRYWPESGRLDPLPAFIPGRDVSPLVRAFPDGKEIVYYGANGENGRTASAHMYVLDLNSQRAREFAPGVNLDPGGSWSPLAVAPDGRSVFVLGSNEDTRTILSVPRKGGSKPQALLSFPTPSAPLIFDVARDGSLYVDQMPSMAGILRFSTAGGAPEEIGRAGPNAGPVFLPNGDALYSGVTGGRQRLMLVHAGAEPRPLLETSEETGTPATTLDIGSIAFIAGAGDSRRIAIATLRDGRIVRRFGPRATDVGSMAAAPDGKTIYYASGGFIWAQPVSGGDPRKITEGTDAALDGAGQHLHVRRNRNGTIELFRLPVGGGEAEKLSVPGEYHLAVPALTPAAVDARGRILVTVLSSHSFYYRPAILDPAAKSLTVVPVVFDGDVSTPSWLAGGRIGAFGSRYISSLWRYRRP